MIRGSASHRISRRRPRRQVRPPARAGLPHRDPGPGAAGAHPAPARPRGRARHRRLRQRLPRLAAGRARPADGAREGPSRPASRGVPARRQRGRRGHRLLGHAAGRTRRRGCIRRGVLPLVRQGTGGGPLRRRAAACEPGRDLEARRGRGAVGRRPRLRILDHREPQRVRDGRCIDPGVQPRRGPGDPGLRALRLRPVALCRLLDRAQVRARHRRGRRLGGDRSGADRDRPPRRPDRSRRRAGDPLAGYTPGAGGTVVRAKARSGEGVLARQPPRPHGMGFGSGMAGGRDHRQVVPRRAAGVRGSGHRRGGGAAARGPPVQGGDALPAGAGRGAALCRGARHHRRRRGEAPAHRDPAQGRAVRDAECAAHRRQARRGRPAPVPLGGPARQQPYRGRARPPAPRARGRR